MSAAMSSQKCFLLLFCSVFALSADAYKLVDIEIDLNPGGEPPKIFTKESLAEFDASDVSFGNSCFFEWVGKLQGRFAPLLK